MAQSFESHGGMAGSTTCCGEVSGFLQYRGPDGEPRVVALPLDSGADHPQLRIEGALRAQPHGFDLEVTLRPAQPLELLEAVVELRLDPELHRRVVSGLANGWQSWSLTRELGRSDTLAPPRAPIWFLRPMGDAGFTRYGAQPGVFHSWSFTHLRLREGVLFAASTAEDSGFTRLRVDLQTGTLLAEKDCAGRRIEQPYRLFGLHVAESDSLESATDGWLAQAGIAPRRVNGEKAFGWTSWYRFFTKIDERQMGESLDAFAQVGRPGDYFQIDDGWEPAVGDWLLTGPGFPHGMKRLADQIRERGFVPGLWLAPFICEKRSHLFRDHPDWLQRDERGLPVAAGWNPQWSGSFYALDLARPQVREHVRQVVRTLTRDWGFELLKMDFLYAAALLPTREHTRGERMADALGLLREAAGDVPLLGCGVPLASAAGRFEYCRIGPDVSQQWEDRLLELLGHRERVSTWASLTNTLNRAHLNRRLFANDPDVFMLRRTQSRLTPREARTLFVVNYLLSGILLFSDDPSAYGEEKLLLLRGFPLRTPTRVEVTPLGELYRVELGCGEHRYLMLVNLGNAEQRLALEPEALRCRVVFDQLEGELLPVHDGLQAVVPARGVRLFKLSPGDGGLAVIGSTVHLFGGAGDVEALEASGDGIAIRLAPGLRTSGTLFVAVPGKNAGETILVDGNPREVEEREGVAFVGVPVAGAQA